MRISKQLANEILDDTAGAGRGLLDGGIAVCEYMSRHGEELTVAQGAKLSDLIRSERERREKAIKNITRQTCEYIEASELFKRHKRVWNNFREDCTAFSWGDNDHSLVTIEAILDDMDTRGVNCADGFHRLCVQLGLQTYVDLES